MNRFDSRQLVPVAAAAAVWQAGWLAAVARAFNTHTHKHALAHTQICMLLTGIGVIVWPTCQFICCSEWHDRPACMYVLHVEHVHAWICVYIAIWLCVKSYRYRFSVVVVTTICCFEHSVEVYSWLWFRPISTIFFFRNVLLVEDAFVPAHHGIIVRWLN